MHEQSQKEKAALNKKVCCARNHSVHLHLDQTNIYNSTLYCWCKERFSLQYVHTYIQHSLTRTVPPTCTVSWYLLILYMNTQVAHFSDEASKLRAVVAEYETVKTDLASTKAR